MDALELALVTRPHQPIADRRAHARMEGPELCRRMRMECPRLRLVIMSGDSDQTPDREVGFLAKPFTVPELRRSIGRDLDKPSTGSALETGR